jgi:hypothetical protein
MVRNLVEKPSEKGLAYGVTQRRRGAARLQAAMKCLCLRQVQRTGIFLARAVDPKSGKASTIVPSRNGSLRLAEREYSVLTPAVRRAPDEAAVPLHAAPAARGVSMRLADGQVVPAIKGTPCGL